MALLRTFCFVLILQVALTLAMVHAQDDQSGFISIDCGITEGSTYTDKKTGINYVSDAGFIDSGTEILSTFKSDTLDLEVFLKTLETATHLDPRKGNSYLIRARFMYGNYDFKGQPPQFDLYLGNDHWSRVDFYMSSAKDCEIIHLTSSDYIHVCLVNIGLGNPFISALELRLLDITMYASESQSLILSDALTLVHQKQSDDKYDRIWYPEGNISGLTDVQTSSPVILGSSTKEKVPSKVMSTAIKPTDPTQATWSTKSTYGLKRNWQGDPCVPRDSIWDGVNCNYNDTDNLRIISMDLSYNNLTGSVPKFLASLDFLRILNLTGNNFTRPLPSELLEKAKKGSLSLSIEDDMDQDTNACPKGSCKNNMRKKVVIVATTYALFMLLTILAVLWITKRRRTQDPTIGDEFIEPRNQRFTYSEVQKITNSFSNVIGKGGFGTVFHGLIGDTQVAVKMLSESSAQGYREFQAEVSLLMSVHHKNITSLVGYCDEGSHKGIIYEYMANGNLGMHLFDQSRNILSWKKRLQIGYDAAQG
ncbi:hypothetical protein L1987_39019 [Smallanthus sonchifolius]|uniref:Uncharacterized protein n=1 Tax=Smallanthus sonchifolius TaxID=185202 RepID=A0ACB9HKL8_9ASTR|nr:hypothetical protein L1987_39019 [Smallanthus sonchifolius]